MMEISFYQKKKGFFFFFGMFFYDFFLDTALQQFNLKDMQIAGVDSH